MATVIVGCILCSTSESSKKRNKLYGPSSGDVCHVPACNHLQQYTELKLLVVMRQVLHCIHTCSSNPILHQRDQQGDYYHNRSIAPALQLLSAGQTSRGDTYSKDSCRLQFGSETNTSGPRTNFTTTSRCLSRSVSPSRRRSQALSAAAVSL